MLYAQFPQFFSHLPASARESLAQGYSVVSGPGRWLRIKLPSGDWICGKQYPGDDTGSWILWSECDYSQLNFGIFLAKKSPVRTQITHTHLSLTLYVRPRSPCISYLT